MGFLFCVVEAVLKILHTLHCELSEEGFRAGRDGGVGRAPHMR